MSNPTPADALRDVIEALDHCMLSSDPSVSAAYVRDTLPQHWLTLRRALETLAAVEAAPVGHVSMTADGGDGCDHAYIHGETKDGLHSVAGQRVALVRVGDGSDGR